MASNNRRLTVGRPPLPVHRVLRDGLTEEDHKWLTTTSRKLQVTKQHLIRVAIGRLRAWMLKGGDARIDITID